MKDRNEILYHKTLEEHLPESPPIVYAPVIARAFERHSHEFRRPEGVFLSIDDIEGIERAFRTYGLGANDVDLLVATIARTGDSAQRLRRPPTRRRSSPCGWHVSL